MTDKPGVIFDMDGVIVHSNPAHKKAIKQFCKNHNQDVSAEFMENRLYGRTNEEWIPELFGEMDTDRLQALADEKEQMFRDMFVPEENIVEGIREFLNTLSSNSLPMAVATSAPRENAEYILSRLSLKGYFDAVLDSSHVSKGKPNPEVYLKASQALDRNPRQCLVFEDSVSGVKAGLDAGAKVVGVATTHSHHELGSCDLVIDNFRELTLEELAKLFA